MPALPLDEAGKYVAGAYVVFVALILVYVSVMSARLSRIERELEELDNIAEHRLEAGEAGRSRAAGGRAIVSEARAGGSQGDSFS
jgi:CcmD family protein